MTERYFEVTWGKCVDYYLTLATDEKAAWEKVAANLGIDSSAWEATVNPTTPGQFYDRMMEKFFIK